MLSHNGKKAAAAIRYSDNDDVPVVIAAALGEMAKRIEEIAAENGITIVKDGVLASILAGNGIGKIPDSLFPAVAELLAFCYKIDHSFSDRIDRRIGKA